MQSWPSLQRSFKSKLPYSPQSSLYGSLTFKIKQMGRHRPKAKADGQAQWFLDARKIFRHQKNFPTSMKIEVPFRTCFRLRGLHKERLICFSRKWNRHRLWTFLDILKLECSLWSIRKELLAVVRIKLNFCHHKIPAPFHSVTALLKNLAHPFLSKDSML